MERVSLKYLKWGFVLLYFHLTVGVDLLPDFVGALLIYASIQAHTSQTEVENRIKPLFLVMAVDYFLHWIFRFDIGLENLLITVISVYAIYVLLGEVAARIQEKQPERAKQLGTIRVWNVVLQAITFLLSAYEYSEINTVLVLASVGMLIAMLVVVCGIQAVEDFDM